MKPAPCIVQLGALLSLTAMLPLQAAVIVTPDTAASTAVPETGFSVAETIDGITAASDNGFAIAGSGLTGTFDYGFSTVYDISGFQLFNDAGGSPHEGISLFNLHFYDSSSNLLTSVTNLTTDTALRLAGPDEYSFSTVTGVQSVILEVLSSYDESSTFGNELAFREVRFLAETNPVPVPAAAWLFASGMITVFGFARRSRNPGLLSATTEQTDT